MVWILRAISRYAVPSMNIPQQQRRRRKKETTVMCTCKIFVDQPPPQKQKTKQGYIPRLDLTFDPRKTTAIAKTSNLDTRPQHAGFFSRQYQPNGYGLLQSTSSTNTEFNFSNPGGRAAAAAEEEEGGSPHRRAAGASLVGSAPASRSAAAAAGEAAATQAWPPPPPLAAPRTSPAYQDYLRTWQQAWPPSLLSPPARNLESRWQLSSPVSGEKAKEARR